MAETKKQGLLARLFGGRKSCCCNVRIEAISEDEGKAPGKGAQPSSCCDRQASSASVAGGKAGAGGAGRGQG